MIEQRMKRVLCLFCLIAIAAGAAQTNTVDTSNHQTNALAMPGTNALAATNTLSALATPATFTNEADFVAALSGFTNFLNDFIDLNGSREPFLVYSNGTFTYTISAPEQGLFFLAPGGKPTIFTFAPTNDLKVSLTSGETMAGGRFWIADGNGVLQNSDVVVTFSDGTQVTAASPAFIGRYSGGTNALTSITVHSAIQDPKHYAAMNHFYVSRPVPGKPAYLVENRLADFVAIGRGLLVDPEWANKGQKYLQVTPCLRCKACAYHNPPRTCPQIKTVSKRRNHYY